MTRQKLARHRRLFFNELKSRDRVCIFVLSPEFYYQATVSDVFSIGDQTFSIVAPNSILSSAIVQLQNVDGKCLNLIGRTREKPSEGKIYFKK